MASKYYVCNGNGSIGRKKRALFLSIFSFVWLPIFSLVLNGLKWLIKAWGWFPILFLYVWNFPNFDQILNFGPLAYCSHILKNTRTSNTNLNKYYFRKYDDLKSWTCWEMKVPSFLKNWNLQIWNFWGLKCLVFGTVEFWHFGFFKLWNFENHYKSQKSSQIIENMVLVELDGTTYYLLPIK